MPRYQIPTTDGRTITIESDRPPTEAEAMEIFKTLPALSVSVKPSAVTETPAVSAAESAFTPESVTGGAESYGSPETRRRLYGALADIGLEGSGAAGGQILGALAGPVGIVAGGGVGAGLGNYAAQKRRVLAGDQEKVKIGELLASIGAGMIPGGAVAKTGVWPVVREGFKQGAGGVLSKNLETAIDEGRLATGAEDAAALIIPGVGGSAAQIVQASNPAIRAAIYSAPVPKLSVKGQTLADAQAIGAVIPISALTEKKGIVPWLNNRIESMAGPADVKRGASEINEKMIKDAAARELRLPDNTEITIPVLEDVRERAGRAYEAVSRLSPAAAADLQSLRDARSERVLYQNHFDRNLTPESKRIADAARDEAERLEVALEAHAVAAGRPELIPELHDARTQIAKSYDVERALNLGDADVKAKVLGRMLEKKKPLSGDLETLGKFALAFPDAVQAAAQRQPVGLSKTEGIVGSALAAGTALATGGSFLSPLAFAIPPLMSTGARKLVLSPLYQKALARVPVPDPVIDATPDQIATAIRMLSQAAGGNEEAAKLFTSKP